MTAINLRAFQGLNKNINAKLLEPGQAPDAYNCDLGQGTLKPYNDLVSDTENNRGESPYPIRTIYLFNNHYWFEFPHVTDVVPGPVADDEVASERTYYTDDTTDNEPRETAESIATASGSYWPSDYRSLGMAYPEAAPSLSVSQQSCSEENKATVSYIYTFVSYWEEEGPPSNPATVDVCTYEIVQYSVAETLPDNQEFDISGNYTDVFAIGSNFTAITNNGTRQNFVVSSVKFTDNVTKIFVTGAVDSNLTYNTLEIEKSCEERPAVDVGVSWTKAADYSYLQNPIAKIYVYRSYNGKYKFVGSTTSSYLTDTVKDADLGESIPSVYYYPPPKNMRGLVSLPNGILAGFTGKEICISEAYLPHAWPKGYRHVTHYEIVGLAVLGSNLLVLTEGNPYLISGATPSRMSMKKLNINQSCVSKEGIVSISHSGVIYPSPDGLTLIDGSGQSGNLTARVMSKKQWNDLNPSTIHAYQYDGKYIGFYDERGGFIIDPLDQKSFMFLDFYCDAGYSDLLTDTLYLVPENSTNIMKWDADSRYLTAFWQSKTFIFPDYTNFSVAKIIAQSYNYIQFRIYADGEMVITQDINSSGIYRLPGGFLAREWYIEVLFQDVIEEIRFGNSVLELKETNYG